MPPKRSKKAFEQKRVDHAVSRQGEWYTKILDKLVRGELTHTSLVQERRVNIQAQEEPIYRCTRA